MNKDNYNSYIIRISKEKVGQRIDNFLRILFKKVPKSVIYRVLRKGKIRVNKKRAKPKYKLQDEDEIRISAISQPKSKKASISTKLVKVAGLNKAILYEDNYILILNKPFGISVHGGSGLSFGVIEGLRVLRRDAPFLELVHRLDKDTSGVLVVAKKRSVLRALHEQLRTRKIEKDYLALVHGQWESRIQTISAPLLRKNLFGKKKITQVSVQGKPSETHFRIEEQFTLATLIRVNPVTGRTHQIRAHAQHAGHPIVLDNLYGNDTLDRQLKHCGLNRLFLHAMSLTFEHPNTGKNMKIEAPLDISLRQCLFYLKNHFK